MFSTEIVMRLNREKSLHTLTRMWMFTVCQSLQVIADNCADIAATMNEFSLSSWTGNGSEAARAEIDQIAKGSNSWSALASQLKELAQLEMASLEGQS